MEHPRKSIYLRPTSLPFPTLTAISVCRGLDMSSHSIWAHLDHQKNRICGHRLAFSRLDGAGFAVCLSLLRLLWLQMSARLTHAMAIARERGRLRAHVHFWYAGLHQHQIPGLPRACPERCRQVQVGMQGCFHMSVWARVHRQSLRIHLSQMGLIARTLGDGQVRQTQLQHKSRFKTR
jgi:hypothetical protein